MIVTVFVVILLIQLQMEKGRITNNYLFFFLYNMILDIIQFNPFNNTQYNFDFQNNGNTKNHHIHLLYENRKLGHLFPVL